MPKHYYFKFGKGNEFLDTATKVNDESTLSVFFNQTQIGWKAEPFLKSEGFDEKGFRERAKADGLRESDIKQSVEFICMSFAENRVETFLWVFSHPYIFVFQPVGDVFDGTPDKKVVDGQQPKSFRACCTHKFSLDDVRIPEFFATIQASQAYNRKTLVELKNPERKVAEHLTNSKMSSKKLKITDKKERFDYLSPVQFETLIFLLFHYAGAFCSAYRGGTRKDIDLRVQFSDKSDFPEFRPNTTYFLQIKKSTDSAGWMAKTERDFLIWLGTSEGKRLGKNWLDLGIQKYPTVEKWLNRSLEFLEY